MVAIVAGNGAGVSNSSANTLGQQGIRYVPRPDAKGFTMAQDIPAYPVSGPIDICGAGDSCSAGITSASSLPMRKRPPSRRTMSSVEPVVMRARSAERIFEGRRTAARTFVGAQQGFTLPPCG